MTASASTISWMARNRSRDGVPAHTTSVGFSPAAPSCTFLPSRRASAPSFAALSADRPSAAIATNFPASMPSRSSGTWPSGEPAT